MGRPVSQEARALKTRVAQRAGERLVARPARPDHHVVDAHRRDTTAHGLRRVVLAVGVHQQHDLARAPRGCPVFTAAPLPLL